MSSILNYETRFHAVFEKFLWRDLESSASIFLFKTKEKIYDERYYREYRNGWYVLSCTSFGDVMFPSLEEGFPITISGHYINKKKDTRNFDFEVVSVETQRHMTDDVRSYLSRIVSKQTL